MAPSSGFHKLVSRNYRLFKAAWQKATTSLQARLPTSLRQAELVPVRVGAQHQPIHPIAYLKQARSRQFSTSSIRNFSTGAPKGVKYSRSSFPASRTASAVNAFTGRAPFASTLRPNLTGGTLGRTAGGYALGGSGRVGGARFFSHGPAAPAQVVQNVSQAVRAFMLSGKKAQYSGVDPRTGEKRYQAVTALQHETSKKLGSLPSATPGSYVDFTVNPTITALTPLASVAGFPSSVESSSTTDQQHINSDGLLDVLSADFSRALKDLAAVLSDLKKLSALGDLPITYRSAGHLTVLRVHFPGCDAGSVETLCLELGITRGVIVQDEAFDAFAGTEIALLFPFAPSESQSEADDVAYAKSLFTPAGPVKQDKRHIVWQDMLSEDNEERYSTQSAQSDQSPFDLLLEHSEEEGYGSLSSPHASQRTKTQSYSADGGPLEYNDDFEGIYRFIEMCDGARR